jgi:hypothetical protein
MKTKPVKILDRDEKLLRNKRVPLVRVSEMKEKFPHLFSDIGT